MKKNTILFLTVFVGIGLASFSYRSELKQLAKRVLIRLELREPEAKEPAVIAPPRVEFPIKQYYFGLELFSDREYKDTIGNPLLDSLTIIQIPRHYNYPIKLRTRERVRIYRLLTISNDNTEFATWDSTAIQVYAGGISCVHSIIMTKEFEANQVVMLPAGGPVASSPILVECLSDSCAGSDFELVD